MLTKFDLVKNGFVPNSYKIGTNPFLNKDFKPPVVCKDELFPRLPLLLQILYTETSPHTFKF